RLSFFFCAGKSEIFWKLPCSGVCNHFIRKVCSPVRVVLGVSMRNIVIHGIEGCLGSHFAAQCLSASADRVFYLSDPASGIATEQVSALVAHVVPQQDEKPQQEMVSRLQSADAHSSVDAAALWYFLNAEAP